MYRLILFLTLGSLFSSSALADVSSSNATTTPLYSVLLKKGSYYKITYVQLLAGNPNVVAAVNSDLAQASLVNDEPCDSPTGSDYNGVVSNIEIIPGVLLSVTNSHDNYCAGTAHPDGGAQGLVYDLATGKRVTLSEQMKGGSTAPLDALLLKQALASASPGENSCNADTYATLGTSAVHFTLTRYAITVWTDYPHYAAACNVDVTVSLKEIKDSLAPGSLAAKLLATGN